MNREMQQQEVNDIDGENVPLHENEIFNTNVIDAT